MAKYDFQKPSKIPYLECAGYKTLIRLRKRRFRCQECGKMAVTETSLIKKNHQIPLILNQKITQKLIEKVAMTATAESLAVSTSTVSRKLKEFQFKTDLTWMQTNMSWDEYRFKKGKMSFIAQDFDSLKVVAILDGGRRQLFATLSCATRESLGTASKSLLWTCLALITLSLRNSSIRLKLSLIVSTWPNT